MKHCGCLWMELPHKLLWQIDRVGLGEDACCLYRFQFPRKKAVREKLPVIAVLAVLQQLCCVIGFILKCDMTFQLLLLKQGTWGSAAKYIKGLHFQQCDIMRLNKSCKNNVRILFKGESSNQNNILFGSYNAAVIRTSVMVIGFSVVDWWAYTCLFV